MEATTTRGSILSTLSILETGNAHSCGGTTEYTTMRLYYLT